MAKQNCWEAKKCGRNPGGAKVGELGTCPAATLEKHDGINGGKNGGRFCWKVTATLCGGQVQGSFIDKVSKCVLECEFFKSVVAEEGANFKKL